MLTLDTFDLMVDQTIVRHGREYYENGAVTELTETGKDNWQAKVKGSELYTVQVEILRKDYITSYSCSCPYKGKTCKHVVAALFVLRGELAKKTVRRKAPEKDSATVEVRVASKNISRDIGKKYTSLIKGIIRRNTKKSFVDYRSVHNLANEISIVLEEGYNHFHKGNFSHAFVVARSVLTETVNLLTYCDDSGGYIQDVIYSCVQLIRLIVAAEELALDVKEGIFVFLQSATNDPVYFDYGGDFGYEMVDIYQSIALQLNKGNVFLSFVDDQIAAAKEESYRKKYFLVRKIVFLKAIGNISDAQQLIQQYLHIAEVRQEEVNSVIEKGNFPLAKKLIADGIEIARSQGYPGIVSDWEEELLGIAVLEDDKATIRHYTKYFAFLKNFDQAYYNQWKETFTPAEWKEEIEKYIEGTIANVTSEYQKNEGKVWYSLETPLLNALAPVYIEEKYFDRLLALMSKEADLDRVLKYHDLLIREYPLQLLAIYLPAFEYEGDVVGSRAEYAKLATKMKMVIQAIPEGKEQIIAIAEKLIHKYPRRPAMIEKLSTVLEMR
ncbi:SWIM zinc finger family protein [Chitinophaga filiformis]|uniref:SWIM zinc finger family protein n=1 Tax=Chitinophaga filiformis TaxID=104663 RepID=UPI001F2CD4D5|nr:SWIM zinc finger family protein [Chitinophaga filiformis]MCF6403689.1 SWIM zinc finger family protein [Chitinophaga filiformis]